MIHWNRLGLIAFGMLLVASAPALAQRAVIFVRHADKETDPQKLRDSGVDVDRLNEEDPKDERLKIENDRRIPLSKAGRERAESLAAHLKNAHVDVIYTSSALRTQQTAGPLADALGLKTNMLEPKDLKRFRKKHRDEVVLIVGHSDTVPELIDELLGRPSGIKLIPENEFDNMYVVVPKRKGSAALIWSRY